MKIKPIYIFVTLCVAFLVYTGIIYFGNETKSTKFNPKKADASRGKLIWQKYNCQCCHQTYSLGGHIGPDLTNVYSKYNNNKAVLKAFFKGGFKQMPKFDMNVQEEEDLVAYFIELDKTGKSDHRTFKKLPNGMIQQDGK